MQVISFGETSRGTSECSGQESSEKMARLCGKEKATQNQIHGGYKRYKFNTCETITKQRLKFGAYSSHRPTHNCTCIRKHES